MINNFQLQISKSISLLRFPLVLMVVFIHSGGFGEFHTEIFNINMLSNIHVYDIIRILVSRILCQVAVPLFFLISGYLFYSKFDKYNWNWSIWIQKLKSRVYTLFIPYISWNILRFIYNETFGLLQSIRHGDSVNSGIHIIFSKISPKIFFNFGITDTGYINWHNELTMMYVPVHTPFWYVRDLILLVIASPLLYILLKRLAGGYILLLVALFVVMPFDGFDIRGLVFFSIGGYLQLFIKKQRTKAIDVSNIFCWSGIWLFLIIGFLNIFYPSILPITVLIGVTTIVIVSMKLSMKVKIDERLSKSSFFIFAFHMFIITLVGTIYGMSHININNEVLLIVLYLLFPIIHCFLSYLAYLFISKNKLLSLFLLGKRN